MHEKRGRNLTVCTDCNKSMSERCLPKHIKLHHSGPKVYYYCKLCLYKTINKSNVKKHNEKVHNIPLSKADLSNKSDY